MRPVWLKAWAKYGHNYVEWGREATQRGRKAHTQGPPSPAAACVARSGCRRKARDQFQVYDLFCVPTSHFYKQWRRDHKPASTLVEVSALVDPRMKVEIEAEAIVID